MRLRFLCTLLLLALCAVLSADDRHKLVPEGAPLAFTAAPEEEHGYVFRTGVLPDGSEHDWLLTGLGGQETGRRGKVKISGGMAELKLALPAGYYELRFPELGQVFGVSVLPPFAGMPDPFFAIEGLLEGRPPEFMDSCLGLLRRNGIVSNREWTSFHVLNPEPGVYLDRNDRVYHRGGEMGIRSIFAFHDFPTWLDGVFTGSRKSLPGTLVGLTPAIERMVETRQGGLEGFQILNEYDAVPIPAEACLPPLKAAAWAVRRHPEIKLIGSAFCRPSMTRESIRGGMLDFIDVFAFHTYAEPEAILPLVRGYRDEMKAASKGGMPIWITESGKSWKRGIKGLPEKAHGGPINNLHPQTEEDLLSALWITMKAVEAKACGVEKYYPFVLPFFQEDVYNFGMLDYYGTPLRSIHSYLVSAGLLAGLRYAGDWKSVPAGLHSVRVFTGGGKAVAVLYAGQNATGSRSVAVKEFPAGRAFGIDGAELTPENGTLKFSGGMAYWAFPAKKLSVTMLNTSTEAMALLKEAERYTPVPRRATPLVYRYDFRKGKGDWNQKGSYRFPADGKLFFVAANLSDRPVTTRPRLEVPAGITVVKAPPESLTIPPDSEVEIPVEVVNRGLSVFTVRLGDAGDALSATETPFCDMDRAVTVEPEWRNPSRWGQNSSGKQTFTYEEAEQALRVDVDFRSKKDPSASHWSFPEYHFSPEEKKKKLLAVSFEFRYDVKKCGRPLFPQMMLAGPELSGYDSFPLAPGGEWKSYMIVVSDSSFRDTLRIGMGTAADELTYWLRNVKLWY